MDDTYNMFRMNLDGSGLETIVVNTVKVFKFGDYLYYFKRNAEYSFIRHTGPNLTVPQRNRFTAAKVPPTQELSIS